MAERKPHYRRGSSDGEPYDDIDARPQIPASRAQLALMFVALVAFAVAIVLALAR